MSLNYVLSRNRKEVLRIGPDLPGYREREYSTAFFLLGEALLVASAATPLASSIRSLGKEVRARARRNEVFFFLALRGSHGAPGMEARRGRVRRLIPFRYNCLTKDVLDSILVRLHALAATRKDIHARAVLAKLRGAAWLEVKESG